MEASQQEEKQASERAKDDAYAALPEENKRDVQALSTLIGRDRASTIRYLTSEHGRPAVSMDLTGEDLTHLLALLSSVEIPDTEKRPRGVSVRTY